jgi:hypothetical protein
MRTVLLQLERLRRHYEVSVRSYDEVSLLDLSHSLRIWADLKTTLPTEAPAFAKTIAFRSALPAKKVMRIARQYRHIFAYMPGGVVTRASSGQVVSGPDLEGPNGQVTVGTALKVNTDGSIELKNFSYVGSALEQPLIKALGGEDVSRGNYSQWMGAEVVRMGYLTERGELLRTSISREELIRRVANTLDGSHPSARMSDDSQTHPLAQPVSILLQYKVGGLPLPYFILLKSAQDILEIAPRLLDKGRKSK